MDVEDLAQRQLGVTKRWRALRQCGGEEWVVEGSTLPSLKQRMMDIETAIWEKEGI